MLASSCLSSFDRATIVHCAWEGNAAAHGLARASYRGILSGEWRDKPPDFLLPFLVTDLIIVSSKTKLPVFTFLDGLQ